MAVTATPAFPQTIVNKVQTVTNSDTTTAKTLYAAGTNGSKVDSLLVTSTDTVDRDLVLSVSISSTTYIIGTVKIPLTAGTINTVPTVDVLRHTQIPGLAYDAFGNKIMYLASGTTLQVAALATVTSGKQFVVFAQGADF